MPSPRVLISAALAASAASSAPAFDYAAPGAFADSLCDVSFHDASGSVLEFDLRRVAAVNVSVPGGQGYQVTSCGVLQLSCSGLVQNLSPGIQLDGDACYEVLATGPPLHELRDPANAATGGLFTRFQSAWTMASDGGKCGDWSPVLGREEGRKLVIEHLCNASLAPGVVVALSSGESPVCTYTLTIASAAACGVAPRAQPAPPVMNPGGPAMPPWRPNAGPFAPFLCSPILADAAAKQWRFALQQLYKSGSDYTVTTALGTFALNVCGHTATTCTPPYAIEVRTCDRAALVAAPLAVAARSDAQPQTLAGQLRRPRSVLGERRRPAARGAVRLGQRNCDGVHRAVPHARLGRSHFLARKRVRRRGGRPRHGDAEQPCLRRRARHDATVRLRHAGQSPLLVCRCRHCVRQERNDARH